MILDGKAVSEKILVDLKEKIDGFIKSNHLGYTISNIGGANLSDVRFKSNIENLTNSLDILNNLQGKSL